jgi:hypothetical protein
MYPTVTEHWDSMKYVRDIQKNNVKKQNILKYRANILK